MTKDQFISILERYKKIDQTFSDLSDIGFDFFENAKFPLIDLNERQFDAFMRTRYNKEGVSWIFWFIYDYNWAESGEPGAWDKDKNPICTDIENLYDYIEANCRVE
ncbi:MAG: hypothetical protein K9I82_02185 [Chitinophagaceae bacterium]|nr:hypothetical protein [Chitinophagaceae bacterium]